MQQGNRVLEKVRSHGPSGLGLELVSLRHYMELLPSWKDHLRSHPTLCFCVAIIRFKNSYSIRKKYRFPSQFFLYD